VRAAGAGGPLPLSGQDGLLRFGVEIEGVVREPGRSNRTYLRWATAGYFEAMGIPRRAGRVFQSVDTADSAPVAVVDAAFARRYFGDADPIGRRVRLSNDQKTGRHVLGVVGAVRQTALDRDADPHVYLPDAQMPALSLTLVIRTTGDAAAAAGSVRDLIRRLDPELPVSNVRTLSDLVAGSTASRRFSTRLLTVFAAVAVLLTLVGVYGVVSQLVAQSTREIGVRIAMGASSGAVVSLMLKRAVRLAVAGVAAGSVAAWVAAPALGGMVYGIAPRDPATLIGVPALLVAAAVLAAYVPARRILRLDVVHALRVE
jgi:putative ABC transport system permease protein